MYKPNHYLYQQYYYAKVLNHSYIEQLKRVMCHQQKSSRKIRFYQTNYLCKKMYSIT